MQLYKVKLNNPKKGKKYLTNEGELCLYTRGEAIKKARRFDGKIEKHGKNFTVNDKKIIQLAKSEISPAILKELEDREIFRDTDEEFEEHIFAGDVFAAILGEVSEMNKLNFPHGLSEEDLNELVILDTLCRYDDYVMFL